MAIWNQCKMCALDIKYIPKRINESSELNADRMDILKSCVVFRVANSGFSYITLTTNSARSVRSAVSSQNR